LHEGFLRVYRYEIDVEKHGGGTRRTSWEVMERGNAVAVLGHDPARNEVVLGNEFRPGALVSGDYPYRDNLVAGAIDNDETALQAAVREMQEEAGLVLGEYPVLGGVTRRVVCPGQCRNWDTIAETQRRVRY
jgi:ADP-ribose pyrophosphatase